jgi:acyl-CoA hydrolase
MEGRVAGTKAQVMSARQAALLAREAGRILIAGCTAEPRAVLEAVRAEPDLWQDRVLTGAFIPGVNDSDFSAIGTGTRVETIFQTPGLLAGHGQVQHLPLHYSTFWRRLARPGVVDLVYMTVPPPRGDGTVGLGLAADFTPAPIAAGARLVGIVNPRMPDPPDGPRLPIARLAGLVEADAPLPELADGGSDPVFDAIAGHVTGLLREGDTLQLGLGKLQGAVLRRLAGDAPGGMAYHGGMISQAMGEAAGAFPRGITTGTALGDAGFYADVAGMAGLRFRPVGKTHALATLAACAAFVSVNSVLEVDLTGQANAEALGGRQISGQGGLVDFLRGARASDGGRAILALPATAAGGRKSRIVPRLEAGTPVTVARGDVDLVVTEYGVADLREAGLAERARRLAAIAAPAFRDGLERELA